MPSTTLLLATGLTALLASTLGPLLHKTTTTLGVFRTPRRYPDIIPEKDFVVIGGDQTRHCEDVHHHAPSGWLFAACEGADDTRFTWYPPLGCFLDPRESMKAPGGIHAIDSKTFKSKKLDLVNFNSPFFTHGIDILTDPKDPKSIYIYAVNHLPSPELLAYIQDTFGSSSSNISHANPIPESIPRARSQLEIFHHKLGSSKAIHLRSIQHPLIRSPNDIIATAAGSIYVTNDHYYLSGQMRAIEDVWYHATWSDTVHVQIDNLRSSDPTAGFTASVALTGLHNNNGLGRGASPADLILTSAASGDVHFARLDTGSDGVIKPRVTESLHLDSSIDNPSYFVDKYATEDDNKSGYVVPGLTKAAQLLQSAHDPTATEPIIVWLVTGTAGAWNKTILFEDDGSRIRSSSGAVMISIDPKLEGGKKKAWLFITGFFSTNMVAIKVDL